MFLDDKLLLIARSVESFTEESVRKAISDMLNACFEYISENASDTNINSVKSTFRVVNNVWRIVAKTLKDESIGLIKEDGFELFVKSKPEFKGLLK